MKLILSGGGSAEKTMKLDMLFASLIPESKQLIYIPIALRSQPLSDSLHWFQSVFSKWSFDIVMWTELNNKNTLSFKDVGAIYIGGGNTYYLLDKLRSSKFDIPLKKFILQGGLVYGGSAGAVVLGKDISLVQDINDSQVKDTRGLNILSFSIFPHYDETQESMIIDFQRKIKNPVLGIPEGAGVFVDDRCSKVVGETSVTMFKGNRAKKYFTPNSLIC